MHILFALSGHVLFAKVCSMLAPQVLSPASITWRHEEETLKTGATRGQRDIPFVTIYFCSAAPPAFYTSRLSSRMTNSSRWEDESGGRLVRVKEETMGVVAHSEAECTSAGLQCTALTTREKVLNCRNECVERRTNSSAVAQ